MDFEIFKHYNDLEIYLDQVTHAADQNKKSLGFLPHPAYRDHALQGRLWVCVDINAKYCGHLIFGGKLPSLKVLQIAVCKEYRKEGIAKRLLRELEYYGESHNCLSITARVAADLPANQFWEKQGYKISRQVDGGKTTGRRINIRAKNLDVPSLFDFSEYPFETQYTDITIQAKTVLANTTFAIDLNVMLDLIKNRRNAEIVQQLLGSAMYGNGQICVTAEFLRELEKRTQAFTQDAILSLAKSLPVLPHVSKNVLEPIVSQLRSEIFPERYHHSRLSENDESDLSHIGHCIHHEVTGFITSDKAILRASESLYQSFGIEILSPLEAVNMMTDVNINSSDELSFSHAGSNLKLARFEEIDRHDVEVFLLRQGVSEDEKKQMLEPGVVNRSRIRWVVKFDGAVQGFSSWGGAENNGMRILFLLIDETQSLAKNYLTTF